MPDFRYTARTSKGDLVDGTVTANDRPGAIAQIELKKITPIRVMASDGGEPQKKAKNTSDPGSPSAQKLKSEVLAPPKPKKTSLAKVDKSDPSLDAKIKKTTLTYAQQYLFSEQLAHLLGAGMTLDESLGILKKRLKHPKLQSIAESLHQSLVDGRSLSQAMRDFPRIFTPLYVNMVSAGEASGSLPIIINRLTTHLAEVKTLRDRVQQALLYPSLLVVVGIGLILLFMTMMVPQLMVFFKDTNAKLPQATQILINANTFITHYWWLILAAIFGVFILFKAAISNPSGRYAWHRFKWNIPVLSRVSRFRYYAQFARTLGTLTQNGVILLKAMELIEDIADNDYIKNEMVQIRAAVVDGSTLSRAVAPRGIFPEMFTDMMGVGEQTGKFSDTMNLIADVYERELDKQVKIVSTLLPPIIMVFVAGIIGTVIYGILIAVFNLTSGMGRGR